MNIDNLDSASKAKRKLTSSYQHKNVYCPTEQFEKTHVIWKKKKSRSQLTNRAILDEQPCFEQARLSREATAAQKKLERPLKPQAVNKAFSLNKFTLECERLERPLQPKRNSSRPLQPK